MAPPQEVAPRRTGLRIALGVLAGLICIGLAALTPRVMHGPDDALILVVYMKHLVKHGVIAWNLQDGPVDGCTSFLDLLLKSAIFKVTGADPVRVTFWVTLAFHVLVGVAGVALLARLGRNWTALKASGLAALCGLLLATSPALADGTAFLLETPLFVFLSLMLAARLFFPLRTTPWSLGLLVLHATSVWMTRPEGLALATGLLVVILFENRETLSRSAIATVLATYVGIAAAYFAWHIHYFGYWAPNTYYAKSSSSRLNEIEDGWNYVTAYATPFAGRLGIAAMLILPFAALIPLWSSQAARLRFLLIQAAALGTVLVVIYSGGDGYSGGRFLAVSIALAWFGLAAGALFTTGWLRSALVGLGLVICATQLASTTGGLKERVDEIHLWPERAAYFICPARFANALQRAIPNGSAAEADFQTLKYVADNLRVIDLHGLSDREIAHRPEPGHVLWGKFSYADALSRRPEAWLWGHQIVRPYPITEYSTETLITDLDKTAYFAGLGDVPTGALATQMVNNYVPASLSVCGKYYNLLVRQDVAGRFRDVGFLVGTAR